MLGVGKYGPWHRLLLFRGASGSVHQVTHTRCLTDAWKTQLLRLVDCSLAGCLLNEGARESSSRQAITSVKHDEGTLATDQSAATVDRGYRN